jgi:predicted ATPase/class 3 adenylate cyclase
MGCSQCGRENRAGRKFCAGCGAPLALACPACGAANEPDEAFCGECGHALTSPASAPAPAVERRLVSILFADLVGFTPLSESRDAEEVRDLLTRYFDSARRVIERYGGTVEKFIGDAVMAVWGAPAAQEDDAERAVRAALELLDAVEALDAGLVARVGMVAGDLVNTAARVQAAAGAGSVLVGEATRRASEAAIIFAPAGSFELKGKAEPVELWRAQHVAAGRGGGRRSETLEPPFVGRDRELRLVKELFQASAEQGKAHLLSVVGIAGIGKSRLAWELEKYLDGLAQVVDWHRGRCLAYGEGVTYWALAEMVRGRLGIAEGEESAAARVKLDTALRELVADEGEREWIEPRLGQLLGLAERQGVDKEDLFAAWRLLFERIAEQVPAALVFEDVQWADSALLEFIGYLLEWSRSHALFVVTLARPDIADRHPNWPRSTRNATTLALEPLTEQAMAALLEGLVPGLPADLGTRIRARAEGVPLYAVETVRMLLDRGLLVRDGDALRTAGPIGSLAVPETLHALVAARLDALGAEERLLLQDASVLGKTFTVAGLAAVSGRSETELEPLLANLARKEVLRLETDPRSPERGQYGFLQDLLRQVAYETLARPERKARHLAASSWLESLAEEPETAEVVASHYLAARDADPEAADADAIGARACEMLVRAGERAASLAAGTEGQRYYERALSLATGRRERAELHERAGQMARLVGQLPDALAHFEEAVELFQAEGLTHAAARVTAALGEIAYLDDRLGDGIALTERALGTLAEDEADADLATLAHQLGRLLMVAGRYDEALARIELALETAEALYLPEVLAHALNTKGTILASRGRPEEGETLVRRALEFALEHNLHVAATRGYNNLAALLNMADRRIEALTAAEAGLELARRIGDRPVEQTFRIVIAAARLSLAQWGEQAESDLLTLGEEAPSVWPGVLLGQLHLLRGEFSAARLAFANAGRWDPAAAETEAGLLALEAQLLLAEGLPGDALERARGLIDPGAAYGGMRSDGVRFALPTALEAALALRDEATVDRLLILVESLPPGRTSPQLRAIGARFAARRAALRADESTAEAGFASAEELYGGIPAPLELAATQIEHAEWLAAVGRGDEAKPLLAEAEGVYERMRATPWLERIARCRAADAVAAD